MYVKQPLKYAILISYNVSCESAVLLRLNFQAPKQAFYPTLTFIALVQPSLQTTQENSKDSLFGGMIPPTGTIPGSFIPSAMPGAGVFNPVGVQHQQSSTDKTPQSAETMEAELTLQGKWVYKHILHNVNICSKYTVCCYFIV